MQLIANALNGSYLRSFLPSAEVEVDGVLAAIAYGQNGNNEDDDLIGNCVTNGYRLDIWMRYDHTVPVGVSMLRRLLGHHKDNIFCRLIPDCLHSKVIWWKGYGAYIGSANLTERAWTTNIEAGLFLSESDLHENQMIESLDAFFEELRELEVVKPLTQEIIDEMERISRARQHVRDAGIELRKQIPYWGGPSFYAKKPSRDKKKDQFRSEWQGAITELRKIGEEITKYRPSWIGQDVPQAWQADQFLHAYYYTQIKDGMAIPFEAEFEKHKSNPNAALKAAMTWWSKTTSPPTSEDVMLHEHAPELQRLLSRESIKGLDEKGLVKVFSYTHATKDHLVKMDLTTLGRPDLKSLGTAERMELYTQWMANKTNEKGWDVARLLEFVLYDGADNDLWERLYAAARYPEYKIPHYGLNSIAELVGWVRPEVSPPRNGRTSKALRALGFDVKVLY